MRLNFNQTASNILNFHLSIKFVIAPVIKHIKNLKRNSIYTAQRHKMNFYLPSK